MNRAKDLGQRRFRFYSPEKPRNFCNPTDHICPSLRFLNETRQIALCSTTKPTNLERDLLHVRFHSCFCFRDTKSLLCNGLHDAEAIWNFEERMPARIYRGPKLFELKLDLYMSYFCNHFNIFCPTLSDLKLYCYKGKFKNTY